MLIVEIDGAQHGEASNLRRDAARDAKLSGAGFKVLRFWNSDVNENLGAVVETIYRQAAARLPTRSA